MYLADDQPKMTTGGRSASDADHVVPLLSLAVPLDSTPHKRDLIQWTVRVQAKEDDAAVEMKPGLALIKTRRQRRGLGSRTNLGIDRVIRLF